MMKYTVNFWSLCLDYDAPMSLQYSQKMSVEQGRTLQEGMLFIHMTKWKPQKFMRIMQNQCHDPSKDTPIEILHWKLKLECYRWIRQECTSSGYTLMKPFLVNNVYRTPSFGNLILVTFGSVWEIKDTNIQHYILSVRLNIHVKSLLASMPRLIVRQIKTQKLKKRWRKNFQVKDAKFVDVLAKGFNGTTDALRKKL